MNKGQRYNKSKDGGDLKYLQTPCTITEAVQISRGVAEDVLTEYTRQHSPLQVAMSLQIEILKDIVIKSGLVTEEDFRTLYTEKAEEFNRLQKEALDQMQNQSSEDDSPKIDLKVSDIEVVKE